MLRPFGTDKLSMKAEQLMENGGIELEWGNNNVKRRVPALESSSDSFGQVWRRED